jgi:hypothetical protein
MRRTLTCLLPLALFACSSDLDDPALSTVEQHVVGDYRARVLALNPAGYWRLGDNAACTCGVICPCDSTMLDTSAGAISGSYTGYNYQLGIQGAIGGDRDWAARVWSGYNGSNYDKGYGQIDDHKAYSLTRDWENWSGNFLAGSTWAQGPDGASWICDVSCGSNYYQRANLMGWIAPASNGATYMQSRPTSLMSGEMQVRVTWSAHAAGGSLVPVALVAQKQDVSNFVRAELVESAIDQSLTLRIVKKEAGGDMVLATENVGTFDIGAWWIVRFRFEGATYKARAWREDLPQPTDWSGPGAVEGSAASAASGNVGIWYVNSGGTARPTVSYTNFWVQTIGFTISMFIKPSSVQPNVKSHPFGKGQDEESWPHGNDDEYYFRYYSDTQFMTAYVFNLEGSKGAGLGTNVVTDMWHHMVVTLDPGDWRDPNAGLSLFWDGRPVTNVYGIPLKSHYRGFEHCVGGFNGCVDYQCTDKNTMESGVNCWAITPLNGNRKVKFGRTGDGDRPFNGDFDELAFFPHALTSTQVRDLYNSSCQAKTRDEDQIPIGHATASSYYNNDPAYAPTKAIDNFATTRWASSLGSKLDANTQQITVDLGAPRDIARVRLVWAAAFAASYDLQISDDGVSWTLVKRITGKTTSTPDLIDVYRTARFVRMQGILRATANGFSIYEFDVFPCDAVP